jgi:hypothetical protein
MAGNPWVLVADSSDKLAEAIDQVVKDSSDDFLRSLGLVSA